MSDPKVVHSLGTALRFATDVSSTGLRLLSVSVRRPLKPAPMGRTPAISQTLSGRTEPLDSPTGTWIKPSQQSHSHDRPSAAQDSEALVPPRPLDEVSHQGSTESHGGRIGEDVCAGKAQTLPENNFKYHWKMVEHVKVHYGDHARDYTYAQRCALR